jgi:hypothetical protein
MAWYALKIILILQLLMEGQLNRIFIETADATDPALKLEHKFMELLRIISGTVRQIFCVAYGAFLVPPCALVAC